MNRTPFCMIFIGFCNEIDCSVEWKIVICLKIRNLYIWFTQKCNLFEIVNSEILNRLKLMNSKILIQLKIKIYSKLEIHLKIYWNYLKSYLIHLLVIESKSYWIYLFIFNFYSSNFEFQKTAELDFNRKHI